MRLRRTFLAGLAGISITAAAWPALGAPRRMAGAPRAAPPALGAKHPGAKKPAAKAPEAKDPDAKDSVPHSAAKDAEPRSVGLWLDGEAGSTSMDLRSLDIDNGAQSAGIVLQPMRGPIIGIGVGPRLWAFRLGPRARAGFLQTGSYYSLGAEIGLHVPISFLEPHADASLGVAALRGLQLPSGTRIDAIDGYYARAGGGLDVRIGKVLSIGGNLSWEMVGMTPSGVSTEDLRRLGQSLGRLGRAPNQKDAVDAWTRFQQLQGTSYGSVFSFTGVVGLRY